MKKFFLFMIAILFAASSVNAQQNDQPAAKSDFSRWSVGINAGLPFFWGDFTSFSQQKTYIGVQGGLQVGYQVSSLIGISLTGDYGQGKMGSRRHTASNLMSPNGMTYYWLQAAPEGASRYRDLYSKVSYMNLGLGVDINVNRIFKADIGDRRWTVLVTPTVYAQKFSSDVFGKSDDKKFSNGSLKNNWGLGLGGALTLRYRVNKSIDLQFKNMGAWIQNNNFDAVTTSVLGRRSAMWTTSLGLVWKIGNCKKSGKRDNLLYYGKTAYVAPVPVPAPAPKAEPKKEEPKKEEPKPVVVAEPVKVELPTLPRIYFARDSWKINTKAQANDIETIVSELAKFGDNKVVIRGFCDHYGTNPVNARVSNMRAKAVKNLLVKKGVAADRLTAEGKGKDLKTKPEKEARRVEIILIEK